jgi:hypothetical protein
MMKLRAHILWLSAICLPSGAAAQQSGVGNGIISVASKVDDSGQIAIEFTDPGNETAKQVAAALGITVGEATSRLKAQARAARLVDRLTRRFPDSFAGLMFGPGHSLRIRALFKGNVNAADVTSEANAAGLGQPVETAPAKMSQADERGFTSRFSNAARGLGKRATFSVDLESGRLTIAGPLDEALRAAAEQAGKGLISDISFDPTAVPVPTASLIAGEAFNSSLTSDPEANCTTGFSVSTGTYYTTTAGHCANGTAESNEYPQANPQTTYGSPGGHRINYGGEYKTNGVDVQWMSPASTADQTGPFYWNGTSSIGVASTFKTEPQLGYSVCKFGRITGWGCGAIAAKTYDSAYGGYIYKVSNGSYDLSLEGDSGGPVVNGSVAYGWIHARDSSTPRNMYFVSIQNVYAYTALRLTLCIPGTNC